MPTTPPDEPDPLAETDLVAYLDGELAPDRNRQVEADLATDPKARADADALRRTFELLDYLPRAEPSATFASRTLTKIEPAATGPYRPASSASTPVPGPAAASRNRWAVAWVVAAGLAGGGGYLASAVAPSKPVAPPLALDDKAVIERLPLYLGVDDLAFLRKLDAPELFAPDADPPTPTGEATPPPHWEALIAQFQAFPAARRQQLRELHDQFVKLDAKDRDRLGRVLEGYAVWLDALPDADRREVLASSTPGERADEVRRVYARSVRAGLPSAVRALLDQTTEREGQARIVAAYRKRENDHRDGWELARRQWDVLKADEKPWPFTDEELAGRIEVYVKDVLRPRLTKPEVEAMERLRTAARPEQDPDRKSLTAGVVYAAYIATLSDEHAVFPEYGNGTRTIRTRDDAVAEYKAIFRKSGDLPRQFLAGVPNTWPEIALAVAAEAKRNGQTLKPHPGPSRPGEFAAPVNDWLAKLPPPSRAELRPLEGKWPEYPKRMLDLSRRLDRPIPEVPTLPGSSEKWAKYYGPVRGPRK